MRWDGRWRRTPFSLPTKRPTATCAAFCARSVPLFPDSPFLSTRLPMIVHSTRPARTRARVCTLGLLLAVSTPAFASAQQPTATTAGGRALSLDDAIRLAARESEALQIARAGV